MFPAILMVSKPVAPPWTDSSKNLVRDLAQSGSRYTYRVLTPRGYSLPGARVKSEPIYRGQGGYSPALAQNLRVMARLLRNDDAALTHFFFAPNLRASWAGRICLLLRPRLTVQTVCSVPASFRGAGSMLFAHRVVVLSLHTHHCLVQAGIDPGRLVHIPPGIRLPPLPTKEDRIKTRARHGLPLDRPVLIFPGDYEVSRAAEVFAAAAAHLSDLRPHVVLACRPKSGGAKEAEQRIRSMLGAMGMRGRASFPGQVPDMLELVGACDLCVLPAESIFAKMDLPLVLLEAMALGVPVVVADRPPLCELLQDEVGAAIPPLDPEALAQTIRALLASPDRLRDLGRNARRAVKERYSIGEVSRRHEDLYSELLESEAAATIH